jgi:hypothetical protein
VALFDVKPHQKQENSNQQPAWFWLATLLVVTGKLNSFSYAYIIIIIIPIVGTKIGH